MTKIFSSCTRRCPDTCQMVLERKNSKVTALSGDTSHPYTRGRLCKSQEAYLNNVVYHPGRVLQPHRREEDTWSSWKVVTRTVAGRCSCFGRGFSSK